MRFCLLIVLICAGTAQAQRGSYFGFGVSCYATFAELSSNYLYPGLQIGGPISIGELRGTLESILLSSNLGLDVLYPIALDIPNPSSTRAATSAHVYISSTHIISICAPWSAESTFSLERVVQRRRVSSARFATYLKGLLTGYPTVEGRVGINLPL